MAFKRGNDPHRAKGGKRPGAGRKPSKLKKLVAAATVASPEAAIAYLEAIRDMADDPVTPAPTRLSGLQYLVNRILGCPHQHTSSDVKAVLGTLSDSELAAMAKARGLPIPPVVAARMNKTKPEVTQ